jgi:lipoprotein-anchoring transpeptidase ErfK/SrfK
LNLPAVLRAALAVAAAAGIACTTAPASEQVRAIAPGVSVLGAKVGGLTESSARHRIERSLAKPITIVYRGETMAVTPKQLGLEASVDKAVRAALFATPRSRIGLPVSYDELAVWTYVESLAKRFERKPVSAKVIGATKSGPVLRNGHVGLAVDQATMQAAIEAQLRNGSRVPLALMMSAVKPARTPASFGAIVVIDRGANTLKLYSGTKIVRTFGVATGQSYYPTPSGLFHVVDKQMWPWWYPPPSPWAAGAKPIPPGPGNPLGTRWMGISAPGVGMHGTPDDASIGYSRSHGCIRMHIPDAEWLYEHVKLGTPVVIL